MTGVGKSESSIFAFVLFSYSRLLCEAWGTHIRTSSRGLNMIITHLIWSQRHQYSDGEDKAMMTGKMANDGSQEVREQYFCFCTIFLQ
jgi:hypothetical protein